MIGISVYRCHFLNCRYIFSTEGHFLPATPEISLINERCAYFGSFCKDETKNKHATSEASLSHQETNDTLSHRIPGPPVHQLKVQDSFSTSGFIKVWRIMSKTWKELFTHDHDITSFMVVYVLTDKVIALPVRCLVHVLRYDIIHDLFYIVGMSRPFLAW